jgi:L-asparaginase II
MLLATVTLAAVAVGPAVAADVSDGDARAVRAVIQAQLKALAADDAALAFSYASPSIRMQFGDASSFMAMVIQGYPMVIHPAEVAFLRAEAVESMVMQVVYLRDQAGRTWLATYQAQRQSDHSWRINGCAVVPADGKSVT